jgi:probable HAF family extracellular repeat protein
MMRYLILRSLAFAAVLMVARPVLAQRLALMYELTELTTEDGGSTRAYAVNNTGQIVGWADVSGTHHAAHWHNRVETDLHGLVHFALVHPFPLFTESYAEAYDVSDGDQVVGTARTAVDCGGHEVLLTNAYVLRPAVLTDLGTPYPGDALTNLGTLGAPCLSAYDSTATGVSNNNHIVGWADAPGPTIHAFLVIPQGGEIFVDANVDSVNDLMIDLGVLDANADPVSSASAVNDSGVVTGYSYTVVNGRSAYHAFRWAANVMGDLGTLGGPNSWGRAINNAGRIVGESDMHVTIDGVVQQYTHAFIYNPNTASMSDLGTLRDDARVGSSSASGINESGVIVGWAENEDRERRAFVYDPADGVMKDLNDQLYLYREDGTSIGVSVVLTEARDINDGGVIVGWGQVRGSDNTRAFLLNPKLVDLDELDALIAANGADNSNANAGGGGATGGGDQSDPEFGPPDNLVRNNPDTGGTTGGTTGGSGFTGLCGGGALVALPATMAGLMCMKAGRRRSK